MRHIHHKGATLKKVYALTDDGVLDILKEDEETYSNVLAIREELMDRVMEECFKSYLKKQTVKFVVQCAYDALVKFLSFNFYHHPEIPDITRPEWVPDQPIEPSPKDTWACDAVPIRPTGFKEVKESIVFTSGSFTNKTSSPKETSTIGEDSKCCLCLEHVCVCLGLPSEADKNVSSAIATPYPSKVRFSPKTSPYSLTEKVSAVASSLESSQAHSMSSEVVSSEVASSITTTSAESQDGRKRVRALKEKAAKKVPKAPQMPLKQEPPGNIISESKVSLVDLPSIRVYSTFSSNPAQAEKKPK
ncbi:uncharacterized protein LOC109535131 [Dendroctonus ponderosae]|uniref:uncharacterized protein LOC109535131 n=1 Tax=Dendroctonus ponderosae TaxID=77166 RepID=UPI002035F562|nr:uncharacterized protein LOC109535131 [Dendroctonus ponderosae]KAH1017482.1 hypothetical protein HUJ05_008115 [Dendroctonus ponderosae]